jgi:hypothetical protein
MEAISRLSSQVLARHQYWGANGNGGQSYKESIYDFNIVKSSILVIAAIRFNNEVNLDCKKTVFTDNI